MKSNYPRSVPEPPKPKRELRQDSDLKVAGLSFLSSFGLVAIPYWFISSNRFDIMLRQKMGHMQWQSSMVLMCIMMLLAIWTLFRSTRWNERQRVKFTVFSSIWTGVWVSLIVGMEVSSMSKFLELAIGIFSNALFSSVLISPIFCGYWLLVSILKRRKVTRTPDTISSQPPEFPPIAMHHLPNVSSPDTLNVKH